MDCEAYRRAIFRLDRGVKLNLEPEVGQGRSERGAAAAHPGRRETTAIVNVAGAASRCAAGGGRVPAKNSSVLSAAVAPSVARAARQLAQRRGVTVSRLLGEFVARMLREAIPELVEQDNDAPELDRQADVDRVPA
jgi:hypothetical protein